MGSGVAIPLHLAVHVLGLTVAVGIAVHSATRRGDVGPGWLGLVLGGLLLAGSHLVTGSLVAGDLAWPLYLRAAGYAALAVGSAGRLLGGATPVIVVAAAPPGAYIAAAVAGAAAAVASFRGVLGHRRDAVVLAVGIALWAGADLAAQDAATVAGVLSIAGSVTVGAWLLWRSRESLLSRVVASFVLALLVLVVGLAGVGGVVFAADLQRDELGSLRDAATGRAQQVQEDWTLDALTTARLFATGALADRLGGDAVALEQTARTIAELPDVDLVALLAPSGDVRATYEWGVEDRGPLPPGDAAILAGTDLARAATAGAEGAAIVVLGGQDVVVAGAAPVYPIENGQARRDRLAGVLVVGRRAADPAYLDDVATATGADVTVVIGGTVARSTLSSGAADVAAAISRGEREDVVDVGGRPALLAAASLESGVSPVAWLVLSEDAATLADAERASTRTLFLAALAGVVAAVLLASWAASRTTRPVRRLTEVAEQVAAGDRDVRTGVDQPDEVGRLADAFDHMTASLAGREDELRTAAAVEAELRGRLEVLTASMGEGLVATDGAGRVQTVNPAAARLLGAEGPALVGRPVADVLSGFDDTGRPLIDSLGAHDDGLVRAARGRVGFGRSSVAVAATAAPLVAEDGQQHGRVYVLRDVTGEAEVERMKTEFLSNMSHELRTPLTPIKGYAEVLRRRELPNERVVAFATNIVEATSRLERIIGMLVDFSALEAGRLRVSPEPTDLSEVVDDALAVWRERIPQRRFSRYLARDLPDVHVDPRLLSRVLEELIDNAVKFSDGPVRLLAERRDGRVRLTVRDNGSGIAVEDVEAIMRDFHQADGSATRQHGGLGLGLSLVRRIADRFAADVVIESVPDEGTDVHLLLPISRVRG